MVGQYGRLVAGLCLMVLGGCGAPDRRDLEYRISKAEGDQDRLQAALDNERAKVVVFQERLTSAQQEAEVARAEINLVRDRVRQLEEDNAELADLLQRRDTVLERPAVSASPLPEELDRKLRAFAARHSGRVWYDRGRGGVSFADDRLFESGSDEVRAAAEALLGELAGIAALAPAEDFEIIVVGHTDDAPISDPVTLAEHPSNWHLSVHRAIAVKNTLVSAGLPEVRLGVMGYGPCRPLGADQARNRRVEIFLARKGEVRPHTPIGPARAQ